MPHLLCYSKSKKGGSLPDTLTQFTDCVSDFAHVSTARPARGRAAEERAVARWNVVVRPDAGLWEGQPEITPVIQELRSVSAISSAGLLGNGHRRERSRLEAVTQGFRV